MSQSENLDTEFKKNIVLTFLGSVSVRYFILPEKNCNFCAKYKY